MMTEKPKIQYIGQFYVPGSEAQVLAPEGEQWPRRAGGREPCGYPKYFGPRQVLSPTAQSGPRVSTTIN